ncbi:hypothetical protein DIPPA_31671 [Diplonema papillatum]|nr:hypothetical protein DIPPA_31671 [Diplonema papillatum]
MGAVLMNPLLLAALALVVNGLALAWRWSKDVPWLEAQGSVQSPGVLSLPYLFLLQGTSFVAAQLLFFPKSTAFCVLGGGTVLAACVASPILLYYYVVRQIPVDVTYVPDPRVTIASTACATTNGSESSDEDEDIKKLTGWKRRVYLFVFGDTVAVSIVESSFYAERWSHICDSYRPKYAVFACLEAGHMIVISLLSAWRPSGSGECNARNFILCLVLFAFAAALLYYRPLKAPMDNLLASTVSVLVFVSMLCMSAGVAAEAAAENVLFSGAAYGLLVTAAIAFLKGIWDVGLYLYDLYIERRSKVRALNRQDCGETKMHELLRTTIGKSTYSDEVHTASSADARSADDWFTEDAGFIVNPLLAAERSDRTYLGCSVNSLAAHRSERAGLDASVTLLAKRRSEFDLSNASPVPSAKRRSEFGSESANLPTASLKGRVRAVNRPRLPQSHSESLLVPSASSQSGRFDSNDSDDGSERSSPRAGLSRRWLSRTNPPPECFSPEFADQSELKDIDVARSYRSLAGQPQISSRNLRSSVNV